MDQIDAAAGAEEPAAEGRFSARRRAALLGELRARAAPAEEASRDAAASAGSPRFDFGALPAHRLMRLQRGAAEAMGIDVPFFRPLDGRAGPVATMRGREMLNFSSYDYLGFNGREEVQQAAIAAIRDGGVSVCASRLVAGERAVHRRLEAKLAALHGVEAATLFVSGHGTNMAAIGTLCGPKDVVLCDALIHNSAAEGAKLSGATRISFPHGDHAWVDDFLARRRGEFERALIVLEGLYSMDGDRPDLRAFVEVKTRRGAWLMVDEAHSIGVLGATGRGIAEDAGVDPRAVEIWMGTLSKTFASTGGYVAGTVALAELMKGAAPGFVFSVGMPATLAAAAEAAADLLVAEPWRVGRLQANGARMLGALRARGVDTGRGEGFSVAPALCGDSILAALHSDECFRRGLLAPPVAYPAVPERDARLRLFVTSEHTEEQIDRAAAICAEALEAARARRAALG